MAKIKALCETIRSTLSRLEAVEDFVADDVLEAVSISLIDEADNAEQELADEEEASEAEDLDDEEG